MTVLAVHLPESLESFVAKQAATEGYGDAGDYVVAVLQQARLAKARFDLEEKLLEGVRELDRGEGREMTAADWDEIRASVRADGEPKDS